MEEAADLHPIIGMRVGAALERDQGAMVKRAVGVERRIVVGGITQDKKIVLAECPE